MSAIIISLPAPKPVTFTISTNEGNCEISGAILEIGQSLTVTVWLDLAYIFENQLGWCDATYADVESLVLAAIISYYAGEGWRFQSHSLNRLEQDKNSGGETNASFVFMR